MNPKRSLRYFYLKLLRVRGEAKYLARGVALGTFIGITPTIPLHTVTIILLSFPMKCSRVTALLAAFVVSNPLTMFPLYYFSWLIGNLVLPGHLSLEKVNELMVIISSGAPFLDILGALGGLSLDAMAVLIIGGFILAAPFALIGYLISWKLFKAMDEQRKSRRQRCC